MHAGEIVGLSGLVGAGRTEVARAVFGIDPYDAGTVTISGKPCTSIHPGQRSLPGWASCQRIDASRASSWTSRSRKNATLTLRKQLARFGIISARAEQAMADKWTKQLQVKTGSLDLAVSTLSGGNQQKVVLAKWLATNPRFLIVDEPTRGIDVGTKAEVHRLMSELAGRGIAILMISSELPEVLGMADTILVMHEGRITATLPRSEATAESVMYAASTNVGGVK